MNIIFDLDGTLVDSSERLYRLFNYLIPESMFSKEEYWSMKRNKINHQKIIETFFPIYSFVEFNERWLSLIETEKYLCLDKNYSDTKILLERLIQDDVILLTARQSKKNLIKELERLEIKDYFSLILTTEAKRSPRVPCAPVTPYPPCAPRAPLGPAVPLEPCTPLDAPRAP